MRHRELARCAPSSTRLCWAYYEEPLMRNTVGYFRTGGKDPLARFGLCHRPVQDSEVRRGPGPGIRTEPGLLGYEGQAGQTGALPQAGTGGAPRGVAVGRG